MSSSWQTHELAPDAPPLSNLHREWLLTNGTGAYAMGTLPSVNTRRYHGLLVAASRPPVGRVMALNQTFDTLTLHRGGDHQRLEMSSLLFRTRGGESGDDGRGDVVVPRGLEMLERFGRGLEVWWRYRWGHVTLTRSLRMHWKRQAITLAYTIRGTGEDAATLTVAPMLTLRDFHAVLRRGEAEAGGPGAFELATSSDRRGTTLCVRRGPLAVSLLLLGGAFDRSPHWWERVHYPIDALRGQEHEEDYFVPGSFRVEIEPGAERTIRFTAALGDRAADPLEGPASDDPRAAHLAPVIQRLSALKVLLPPAAKTVPSGPDACAPADLPPSTARRARRPAHPGVAPLTAERLAALFALAGDDFIVDRTVAAERLATVIAGYPWFADWGRDTFIALPGLMLATGRFDDARSTLAAFARHLQRGLVPNRFDDYSDTAAHYNTVDASLWYVWAALQYLESSGDRQALDGWLGEACLSIIDAYLKGTDHDIRAAGDGLITAGNASTQLTWMDAACGGVVFTPRHGKAVEINCLWRHALAGLARHLADDPAPPRRRLSAHFLKLCQRIDRAFAKVFWNEPRRCLFDTVWLDEQGQEHRDPSMRPNQILVASLPDSPLPLTRRKMVVDAVGSALLTPFGLRTLPPDDPRYHPHYGGDGFHRDQAYHQGTVWPWLIGPYAEALLRTGRFSDDARRQALAALSPLISFTLHPGLGQLYEIHEADPPHAPVGTMAQAWSVAEVLRVLTLAAGPTPDLR